MLYLYVREKHGKRKKNIDTAIRANMLRNFILYAFRYGRYTYVIIGK